MQLFTIKFKFNTIIHHDLTNNVVHSKSTLGIKDFLVLMYKASVIMLDQYGSTSNTATLIRR